jgi:hypothetical protein
LPSSEIENIAARLPNPLSTSPPEQGRRSVFARDEDPPPQDVVPAAGEDVGRRKPEDVCQVRPLLDVHDPVDGHRQRPLREDGELRPLQQPGRRDVAVDRDLAGRDDRPRGLCVRRSRTSDQRCREKEEERGVLHGPPFA